VIFHDWFWPAQESLLGLFLGRAAEEAPEPTVPGRWRGGHERLGRRCGHVPDLVDDMVILANLDREGKREFAMLDAKRIG
jgi:hypothetical protein